MSENGKKELTFNERLAVERELLNGAQFGVPVVMGLAPLVSICGLLQLAMRHPGTAAGPAARIARTFIDGLVQSLEAAGFKEHAQLVRMGDNPANDAPADSPIVQA